MSLQKATPAKQIPLDLGVEVQKDINGVEMGILENGIPYLTQRGLSLITGVARNVLQTITQEWEEHYDDIVLGKDRISFIIEYLRKNGYSDPKLFIETNKDGRTYYCYPDIVCMALLEYYAFESKSNNETALDNYRKFAAYGLRKFIYEALEYTPSDKWKFYNDRVSLLKNSCPSGYFGVFNEITGLIVDLINADVTVNHKTVPDISVGKLWGTYWIENNCDSKYGARTSYEHNYPSYYPQAASNPQKPNAYPDAALPLFREWFKSEYLPTRFPKYILTKANLLPGGKEEALTIANMYQGLSLQKK
ncbi:hypothetical protein HUS85_27635 [Pseudomonas protegens]|jgi:hypothetical protein|uniref:hypothetical protein n=1 Tax=Pseudomonas protegens TaxID=380021 RepID=UPI001BB72AD2|nr:hypothetical protein [Pseudomonas protegens]MBP5119612.1 hypothetical protein [Pseudomonas protegens]MCC3698820.1 hypothetical protein [Staphylococcus epidermidis]QTU20636.1 hypothetical protein HUT22_21715 [Pseudomonas protegens]WHS04299.1 hypothetical protein [Pseudomonas phage PseuP_222]